MSKWGAIELCKSDCVRMTEDAAGYRRTGHRLSLDASVAYAASGCERDEHACRAHGMAVRVTVFCATDRD